MRVKSVACRAVGGLAFACVLTVLSPVGPLAQSAAADDNGGTVVAWGENSYGQTHVPAGLSGVTAIAAGGDFGLALTRTGQVVGWGSNDLGETSIPPGLSGVTAIAAGENFSLALKSDGTVVAWGSDTNHETDVPASVLGQSDALPGLSAGPRVVAISAGRTHSLALMGTGTVVTWGDGAGDVPVGLTGVTAISAGDDFSLALKSDGTVVGWGSGGYESADIPEGLKGVVAISAGFHDSLALTSDGRVVEWGFKDPVFPMPANLAGIIAIAADKFTTSLALRRDGSIVEWGGPFDVPGGLVGVKAIASGGAFSLALVPGSPPLGGFFDRRVVVGVLGVIGGLLAVVALLMWALVVRPIRARPPQGVDTEAEPPAPPDGSET